MATETRDLRVKHIRELEALVTQLVDINIANVGTEDAFVICFTYNAGEIPAHRKKAIRDPRVTPKRGDRLMARGTTRRVDGVVVNTVNYNGNNWCWLSTWQRWARIAEVLERAK